MRATPSSSSLIAGDAGGWLIFPQPDQTQAMNYHSHGIGREWGRQRRQTQQRRIQGQTCNKVTSTASSSASSTQTQTSTQTPTTDGRHDQIPRLCTHLQTSESGSYAGESGGHTREAKTTSNSVGINETPLLHSNQTGKLTDAATGPNPQAPTTLSIWATPND